MNDPLVDRPADPLASSPTIGDQLTREHDRGPAGGRPYLHDTSPASSDALDALSRPPARDVFSPSGPALADMTGRYPEADWRPIAVNFSPGGNTPRLFMVHIMQGTLEGTDAWFRDPAAQVSAHFGVGRRGAVYQWVRVGDTAWHAAAANAYSIGVEHEGWSGEPLTDPQLEATAGIFRWAREHYGQIHNWLNLRPYTGSGLTWHGLGGAAWGNHLECPGVPIVHQLAELRDLGRDGA